MKKMLMVATVPSMIAQFNMNNIQILQKLGYEVHIACDFTNQSVWNEERIHKFQNEIKKNGLSMFQTDFSRSATHIYNHIRSYKQLLNLIKEENYTFIHCHTPIAGAITRMACKKTETICIYTAHGFHFYKGAPLRNWLLYYPIENWLSKYTNVLITINNEDYERAQKVFKSRHVEYLPGIGLDLDAYKMNDFNRLEYRKSLDLNKNDFMILSVGELNRNKNHKSVIKALGKMKNKHIHYFIAGKGKLEKELFDLANKEGIGKNVHLLGFRTDVKELYHSADLFIHPSFREGLPVALMEAMSSRVPCIASNIRGNIDLISEDSGYTFPPDNIREISNEINLMVESDELRKNSIEYNGEQIRNFSSAVVDEKMKKIYTSISL